MDPFPITAEEVARRTNYLDLAAEDAERIRTAGAILDRHADEIIDRFYEYLLAKEQTRAMLLREEGLVERLKVLQMEYFRRLTAGVYDVDYFRDRLKVGLAHNRVGLSPEWYLGAYLKYLHIVTDILRSEMGGDSAALQEILSSIRKVIFLDMSLALDAYIKSAQATLEDKNRQLHRSTLELQKAQAVKQQLTEMIIHDLQNPLSAVDAFLKDFRSRADSLPPDDRRGLEEAVRRSEDLHQMILNVLQVSRAETGGLQVYWETFDVAAEVREIVAAFQPVAALGGRELTLEGAPELKARADRSLLRRILGNLLRNALRHTPRGTRVRVSAGIGPLGAVQVSVADTGRGIPPDLQPILFESYASVAMRKAGLRIDSGLGLAFCKVASEAMGGRISLESDGRSGCVFRVTLQPMRTPDFP